LADEGAKVTVCARIAERARSVAQLCGGETAEIPPVAGTWDLLVNTTPVGTYPDSDESPLHPNDIKGQLVYDLVYNPPVTRLLADASGVGCSTIGGLAMLVAQAERQFKWWTGQSAPADGFRCAAEARLESMTLAGKVDEMEAEK
jgi:shikimate 5-dehydrogenase